MIDRDTDFHPKQSSYWNQGVIILPLIQEWPGSNPEIDIDFSEVVMIFLSPSRNMSG
jgi:hypothetical protein